VLKRKIYSDLSNWKNCAQKTALIVTGVSQCGKSSAIRDFGMKNYSTFVEFNFSEHQNSKLLKDRDFSKQDLYIELSRQGKTYLLPGRTLIFLDEVQTFKQILPMIPELVSDNKYDFILSGSFLNVEMKEEIESLPQKYIQVLEMYPLNFEEFLTAHNVNSDIFEYLEDCFINKKTINEGIHNVLMNHFNKYLLVGGMPAPVEEYLNTLDLNRVDDKKKHIDEVYRTEITRYSKNTKQNMVKLYNNIQKQVKKNNIRFKLSEFDKNARFENAEHKINWLVDAGFALSVPNVTELNTPLGNNESKNLFKLYKSDIGLVTKDLDDESKNDLLENIPSKNKKGLYENALASELLSNGYKLFYYNINNKGKIVFMVEIDNKIIPLVIKGKNTINKHSLLNILLDGDKYNFSEGYALYGGNLIQSGKITYLPIYMSMFLKNNKTKYTSEPLDLVI